MRRQSAAKKHQRSAAESAVQLELTDVASFRQGCVQVLDTNLRTTQGVRGWRGSECQRTAAWRCAPVCFPGEDFDLFRH